MRMSDWSSDVCSSDLRRRDVEIEEAVPQAHLQRFLEIAGQERRRAGIMPVEVLDDDAGFGDRPAPRLIAQHRDLADRPQRQELAARSEEHTSELQSLMRISYAVLCLKNKHKTL